MCTHATFHIGIDAKAKGPQGKWFSATDATVYFDHPVSHLDEHTLNIDFADPSQGPAQRVAVELSESSARELIATIEATLASAAIELGV